MPQRVDYVRGIRRIRGVIFDMDGTLTVTAIDFAAMRRRLAITEGDMLAAIRQWPADRRRWAFSVIEEFEDDALKRLQIQPGVDELLAFLDRRRIPKGIITRNSSKTTRQVVAQLRSDFSAIITREFEPVKPAPEPALHIAQQWRLAPAEIMVVGDYRDDLLCGRAAGMPTCLLINDRNREFIPLADYTVADLYLLKDLIAPMLG